MKQYKIKKGRSKGPGGNIRAWKGLSFSNDAYNIFLCSLPSFERENEKTITGPAEKSKDQQGTSKKQQQDQQDQQDQHKINVNRKENNRLFVEGVEKSDLCRSPGPDSVYAGFDAGPSRSCRSPDKPNWSLNQENLTQILSEMEKSGDAYHEDAMVLEGNLDSVGEAREIFQSRGWKADGPVWHPPSRM